jgi:hypothetical protein
MISIIVCHRDKDLLKQFKENVTQTIGLPFEFVIIDNSTNKHTIFEAYNLGIERSKGDVLCFAHEDLFFHTNNWGPLVNEHFNKNPKLGLIGVCGGKALPNVPAPWWNKSPFNQKCLNLYQQWNNTRIDQEGSALIGDKKTHEYINQDQELISNVTAVDGLWFCIKTSCIKDHNIKFDTETFKGFHCYDLDICMQIGQYYDVAVIYDVLLEHFSEGSINKSWVKSSLLFTDKWQKRLQEVNSAKFNESDLKLYNLIQLLTYCYWVQSKDVKDADIKAIIKKNISQGVIYNHQKYWLLKSWSLFGYQVARYCNKIFMILIKLKMLHA